MLTLDDILKPKPESAAQLRTWLTEHLDNTERQIRADMAELEYWRAMGANVDPGEKMQIGEHQVVTVRSYAERQVETLGSKVEALVAKYNELTRQLVALPEDGG